MKVVRCNNKMSTPYLRQYVDLFTECVHAIDLGCGNGRNSELLKEKGMHVMSLDAKPDYGIKWLAGNPIPVAAAEVDLVLCNYLLMFLEDHARNDIYNEIDRICHADSFCVIELEMVKQSLTPDSDSLHALNDEVCTNMIQRGWNKVHGKMNHYIFQKIG